MVTHRSSWFVCIVTLLSCLSLVPALRKSNIEKSIDFNFAGQNWVLPITVKQAVANYHLHFLKPNIFRTTLLGSGSMHVEFPYYHNSDSPFLGEPNSDSLKFYDRSIHTYCFAFSDTLSNYDSLKSVLQRSLGQPFVAYEDTVRFSKKLRETMFSKGTANYELLRRPDSSYVAIRHQPRQAAYYPAKLQVFFFYGLPYKDIYHRLTVF